MDDQQDRRRFERTPLEKSSGKPMRAAIPACTCAI